MAHLFFSYAHADAERLNPIHAHMQNGLERNLWLDKVGLERGMAWENAIKAAIDDSYGVILAVTETFVTRPFILEKEIPWALARFDDKQGTQIFPILFDDVPLPPELIDPKVKYITHIIQAFDRAIEDVLEELKRVLPTPQAGAQPFVVDWPRLTNFKGRDAQLIELHNKLMGDGRVGVKTAGLHGTGGIGKTQLAVEYAHRYRYHYPGGVYWLNASADWRKEVAACADRLGLTAIDPSDSDRDKQMALAFLKYLEKQTTERKDALLVLDNVDDPTEVKRREVAPKLTINDLCEQTRTRLLLTTRVQTMPNGFESVSVDVLKPEDASGLLLDAWVNGGRKEAADRQKLDEIAKALGYLPLGLSLATAALSKRHTLTPARLLEHLRELGIDLIADKVGLEKEDKQTKYVSRVDVALAWQIKQLGKESCSLLALLAAYSEATVTPSERLRLLSGLVDDGLEEPFRDAVAELTDYHLVEPLSDGTAFRLHPLTQVYAMRHLDATTLLNEAVPRLVVAYRDPATFDAQIRARGFAAILEDLSATQALLTITNNKLDEMIRLLTLEEPSLLVLSKGISQGYVIQQIRERAHHESDDELKSDCDKWLMSKRYLHHDGLRYSVNKTLLRTLVGHISDVNGALALSDGRILSWSEDETLRLWSSTGEALTSLSGHKSSVKGALALSDGRILSWSNDNTLRLWSNTGEALTSLSGHKSSVKGALVLADGRILSWSNNITLWLWSNTGRAIGTLSGHRSSVNGALTLPDGCILSWSNDTTLRLWSNTGVALASLNGHKRPVNCAFVLADRNILSWSEDETLRLWSSTGEALTSLSGHTGAVNGALALSDGRILSWSNDSTLRLWSSIGEALATIRTEGSVKGVLALSDGRILSWNSGLQLWSNTGEALADLNGHTGFIRDVQVLPDGRILSQMAEYVAGSDYKHYSWKHSLGLWSSTGELLTIIHGHTDFVNGALALPDGRILSWSHDKTLRLWSNTGEALATLRDGNSVNGALVLADGRILSWSYGLRLWSNTGEALTTIRTSGVSVKGVLALPDGRILSWSSTSLQLWSGAGKALADLNGHTGQVIEAIELSSGRILSWADDWTLRLWSDTGEPLTKLEGHTNHVQGALELVDGRILSWSDDWKVRLWSAEGEPLAIYSSHSAIRCCIETKEGRIVTGDEGGRVLFLTLEEGI